MEIKQIRPEIVQQVRAVIMQARCYVTREETWTKARLARDWSGDPVSPLSEAACRFCALGAIRRAVYWDLQGLVDIHDWTVVELLGTSSTVLANLNDVEGRLAVLALFDDWLKNNPG